MKQKLLALESVRGIAAISVAFYHFNVGSHFNNSFVSNAWLMVDFFFVLSGFVIALSYMKKLNNFSDIVTFQTKRFLRLYPLHLIMLFLLLGVEFSKYIAEKNFGMVANNRAFSQNNLSAFMANIFLVQNWTHSNLTYNAPSWSISAEFITYALFAIIIMITKANRFFSSVIIFICVLLSWFTLQKIGMGTGNISGGPVRCLYSFSIGVLVFFIYEKVICKFGRIHTLIPLGLTALSIYVVSTYGVKGAEYVTLIPLLFGMTILSISLDKESSVFNKALSMKWLVYLGTISYGIYMIHALVWWLITQFIRFILNIPASTDNDGKTKIIIDNIFAADALSLIGIFIVILLAHISHKYFERRFTFQRFYFSNTKNK